MGIEFKIQSVQRKSDGEIFSIGDSIENIDNYKANLKEIEQTRSIVTGIRIIIGDDFNCYAYLSTHNGGVRLDIAKK